MAAQDVVRKEDLSIRGAVTLAMPLSAPLRFRLDSPHITEKVP